MPIYEFKCNKCGMEFEQIVFSSTEEVPCPACGKKDTCRLMSCFSSSSSSTGSVGGSTSSCSSHSSRFS